MGRSKKRESSLAVMLGGRIRALRQQLQWTQEDLAGRLGVEVNTVSRMECGTHLPSLQRLEEIADILDVPLAFLVGAASSHPKDQVTQLNDVLVGLSESQRKFILDIARQQSEFFKAK
ncbi:hypothetical protein B9N43_13820 [Denitratisoma sp. DHT3]|uniref:helix-turn-helix domain-containing protein n=1 Tax=Denitratisoma sp. DHT3 TaxID=1981880 RepID=UPI001198BAB7|nr:helix-turn-helix transcriptional regulator [Denitratisoma sp. DHT3]QDX82226.1 hypothetical protein B9N43_13820 [Denitratisoma sp. DHT3]